MRPVPRLCALLCALLSLACGLSAAGHAEHWTRVATPRFELYTDGSLNKARNLLIGFERTRQLFRAVSPSFPATEFPLRIIAFRSQSDYNRYALTQNTEAYFLCRLNQDYIVLQENDADAPAIAAHEYAHYVLHADKAPLPAWLHEGMAEYYSTIEKHPDGILVGRTVRDRAETLQHTTLLPISSLFAKTEGEITTGDLNQGALFYAESWALVHMLQSIEKYHEKFPDFLNCMKTGEPAATAIRQTWAKSVDQIQADLVAYVNRGKYQPCFFSTPEPATPHDEISIKPLQADEAETLLADLSVKLKRFEEGRKLLVDLAQRNPRDAQVEEALAYLYLEEKNYAEAGWHCAQAIAKGSRNPRLYFQYAQLLETLKVSGENRTFCLRRAVDLKPDYVEAVSALAQMPQPPN